MNTNAKKMSPMQVHYFIKHHCNLGRKFTITVDENEYDLLESCYFNPLLLFRFHDIENEKSMTLSIDTIDNHDCKMDIYVTNGQIQISEHMFIPFTNTYHLISTNIIARADGTAITIY